MTTAPDDGIPVVDDEPTEPAEPAEPKPRVLVDEDGDLRCSTCGNTQVIRKTVAADFEVVGWDFKLQIMEAYKSYDLQVEEERFDCDDDTCPATVLEWTEDPAEATYETGTCGWCHHDLFRDVDEGTWLAPDAGFDEENGDGIWRAHCPDNDTERAAPHEPA